MSNNVLLKLSFNGAQTTMLLGRPTRSKDADIHDIIRAAYNSYIQLSKENSIFFVWKNKDNREYIVSNNVQLNILLRRFRDVEEILLEVREGIEAAFEEIVLLRNESVHEQIECSECHVFPIIGPRSICTVRMNYNLCGNCESIKQQPFPVLKLYNPYHIHLPIVQQFQNGILGESSRSLDMKSATTFDELNSVVSNDHHEDSVIKELNQICSVDIPKQLIDLDSPILIDPLPVIRIDCIDDITFRPGTVVEPNTSFLKIWRLRNNGINVWPEDLQLVCDDDNELLAPSSVSVNSINVGQQSDLMVRLTAPTIGGRYIQYFKFTSSSCKLEDNYTLKVDITVQDNSDEGWQSVSGYLRTDGMLSRQVTETASEVSSCCDFRREASKESKKDGAVVGILQDDSDDIAPADEAALIRAYWEINEDTSNKIVSSSCPLIPDSGSVASIHQTMSNEIPVDAGIVTTVETAESANSSSRTESGSLTPMEKTQKFNNDETSLSLTIRSTSKSSIDSSLKLSMKDLLEMYDFELTALRDMGFNNTYRNLQLLRIYVPMSTMSVDTMNEQDRISGFNRVLTSLINDLDK